MSKVFQLRAKSRLSSQVDKGFTFNVPSSQTMRPLVKEIEKALRDLGVMNPSVIASKTTEFDYMG